MKLNIDNRDNFHFLKGNHENILNANFGGDYSFYKYANEGEMVRQFMLSFYNEKLLYLIAKYENLLPLVAAGKNYVVSHGEPADVFTKEQLIDAKFEDNVVEGLIWTKNGEVVSTSLTYKFVANEDAENLYLATRNLGNCLVLFADEINVYDIVNADMVVIDESSLKQIEEVLK